MFRWLGFCWKWWNRHWIRFQAIATPGGSLLTTLLLSRNECVGWCLTSQAEVEVASRFASAGILIYTASFAALETGVMTVVLAWQVKEFFERITAERLARLTAEVTAEVEAVTLARRREAERLSRETGEDIEVIYERLRDDGWEGVG